MFLEVLQAYYAPVVLLVFFTAVIVFNQFLSRREKRLFLIELGIVGLMIASTWTDRCISAITTGNWWKLRYFTSILQFALAPLSPLALLWIYERNSVINRRWVLLLPAIITAVFSFTTPWTELVLRVVPGNIYTRGPLFLMPFVACAIYIAVMFRSAIKQTKSGRKSEATFLFFAGCAVAGACVLEITFVIRYMVWSTTAVLLLVYFLMVTMQKVLYDPLTGAYSRIALTAQLESLGAAGNAKRTMAMIDMNNLKVVNDRYGHEQGDLALIHISRTLMDLPVRRKKLYRYGGDEFVLVLKGYCGAMLTEVLDQASMNCGAVEDISLSFAYGVAEYRGGSIHDTMESMDKRMYRQKAMTKRLMGAKVR